MGKYFNDMCNIFKGDAVNALPYPFAYGANVFPEEIYRALDVGRPDWKYIAGKKWEENNKRVDICAWDVMRDKNISPIWREFCEYHTSHAFYLQILKRFGGFFKEYYPQYCFENLSTAVRNGDRKADIYLDCQICVNTPVKEKCSVSPPHLDHPNEIWAAMFYMREADDNAGGDFIIYKLRDLPREKNKRQIHVDGLVELYNIKYAANNMVCFMNSPFSVHAVTEREVTDRPRLMANIVLEFRDTELFNMKRMQ